MQKRLLDGTDNIEFSLQTQTLDMRDSMPSHTADGTEMRSEWKQAEIKADSPDKYVTTVYSVASIITCQGQTKKAYVYIFFPS